MTPNSSATPDAPFQLRFLPPPQVLQPPQAAERLPSTVNVNTDRRKTLSGHTTDTENRAVEAASSRMTPDLERAAAKAAYVSRCANETLVSNRMPASPVPRGLAGSVPAAAMHQPAFRDGSRSAPSPPNWGAGSAMVRTPAALGTQGSGQQAGRATAGQWTAGQRTATPATLPRSGPSRGAAPSISSGQRPTTPPLPYAMTPAWSSAPPGPRGTQVPSVSSRMLPPRGR